MIIDSLPVKIGDTSPAVENPARMNDASKTVATTTSGVMSTDTTRYDTTINTTTEVKSFRMDMAAAETLLKDNLEWKSELLNNTMCKTETNTNGYKKTNIVLSNKRQYNTRISDVRECDIRECDARECDARESNVQLEETDGIYFDFESDVFSDAAVEQILGGKKNLILFFSDEGGCYILIIFVNYCSLHLYILRFPETC